MIKGYASNKIIFKLNSTRQHGFALSTVIKGMRNTLSIPVSTVKHLHFSGKINKRIAHTTQLVYPVNQVVAKFNNDIALCLHEQKKNAKSLIKIIIQQLKRKSYEALNEI